MTNPKLHLNGVDEIRAVLTALEVYKGKTVCIYLSKHITGRSKPWTTQQSNMHTMRCIFGTRWNTIAVGNEYPRVLKLLRDCGMLVPTFAFDEENNLSYEMNAHLLVPLDENDNPDFTLLGEILTGDLSTYLGDL